MIAIDGKRTARAPMRSMRYPALGAARIEAMLRKVGLAMIAPSDQPCAAASPGARTPISSSATGPGLSASPTTAPSSTRHPK